MPSGAGWILADMEPDGICTCGTLTKMIERGEPVDKRTRCPDCGGTAQEFFGQAGLSAEATATASAEVIPEETPPTTP
jgi:hypothetical protein